MYFVPLSQLESVELVVHSLRAAGGQAECPQCPAYKVCTRQCLSIASAVGKMLEEGSLPQLTGESTATQNESKPDTDPDKPSGGAGGGSGHLKVIK